MYFQITKVSENVSYKKMASSNFQLFVMYNSIIFYLLIFSHIAF